MQGSPAEPPEQSEQHGEHERGQRGPQRVLAAELLNQGDDEEGDGEEAEKTDGDVEGLLEVPPPPSVVDQPFTPPAVRPDTIRRWKISTRMISGTVTTAPAAMVAVYGTWCGWLPVKLPMATVTVCVASFESTDA